MQTLFYDGDRVADLVHDLLTVGAPDNRLLTFAADGKTWTRGELSARGERCADALASLSVGAGDRVAVMLPNRIEYIDIIFGCSLLGAIVVHLHTAAKGQILARALRLAAPTCVVALAEDVHRFAEIDLDTPPALVPIGGPVTDAGERVSVQPELALLTESARPRDQRESPVSWQDPACIYSSSGTTGPAKGVTLPHRALFEMTRTAQTVMRFEPGDVAYTVTPLYHANAFVFMFMSAALAGAHTVLAERFSLSQFWPDVERFGATTTSLVGAAATLLLKHQGDDAFAGSTLKLVAAIPRPKAWEEFEERFDVPLTEFYGSTEANLPLGIPFGERQPETCGRVLDGWECKIVDEDDNEVPADTPGQLLVRPREPGTVSVGYWGEPEKTVELWQNLWIRTGDLLRRDDDGWFYYVDRLKDAIRVSGENVASADIEAAVASFDGILEAAAYGVPSELGEQDVMVAVVAHPGAEIDWPGLRAHCLDQLPYYAAPRYFEALAEFPRTPTERVKKAELRARGVVDTTVDLGRPRRTGAVR
jgi:crotonobetaine/carnitine-CoA ligase